MRISEKTIELTFCYQIGSHVLFLHDLQCARFHIVWFGLTQRQEARLGFDMATRLGGRILVLQFKASNQVLKNGQRRFHASHVQMKNLRRLARKPRAIYYVLPDIGGTPDLTQNPCMLDRTWFLDVSLIPDPVPPPTVSGPRATNVPRKSGDHYIDLDARSSVATLHSDPWRVPLMNGSQWIQEVLSKRKQDIGLDPGALKDEFPLKYLGTGIIGGVIYDAERNP